MKFAKFKDGASFFLENLYTEFFIIYHPRGKIPSNFVCILYKYSMEKCDHSNL